MRNKPLGKKGRGAPAVAREVKYWAYANNVEGALRNGSFVRKSAGKKEKAGKKVDRFAVWMNGDFMEFRGDLPKDMKEVDAAHAESLLPGCCLPIRSGPPAPPPALCESCSPAPPVANPMNPENIEAGDTVLLEPLHDVANEGELRVLSVTGRYGNKVFTKEVGHELYATCFKLVRKGKGGS